MQKVWVCYISICVLLFLLWGSFLKTLSPSPISWSISYMFSSTSFWTASCLFWHLSTHNDGSLWDYFSLNPVTIQLSDNVIDVNGTRRPLLAIPGKWRFWASCIVSMSFSHLTACPLYTCPRTLQCLVILYSLQAGMVDFSVCQSCVRWPRKEMATICCPQISCCSFQSYSLNTNSMEIWSFYLTIK